MAARLSELLDRWLDARDYAKGLRAAPLTQLYDRDATGKKVAIDPERFAAEIAEADAALAEAARDLDAVIEASRSTSDATADCGSRRSG